MVYGQFVDVFGFMDCVGLSERFKSSIAINPLHAQKKEEGEKKKQV